MNNKKVIDAIRNNDNSKLFKLLYKHYFSMVEGIVVNYNGSKDDAKDVFQEMILVLIREVDNNKIDESKNIKNYIYTISKNLFLNILRDRNKNVSIDSVQESDFDYRQAKSHIELKESEELVSKIIKELGEKCFEILKRILFENKKQEEIAEELGLKDRFVVKTYKNRCKNKLIDLMKKKPKLCLELINNEEGFGKHISFSR